MPVVTWSGFEQLVAEGKKRIPEKFRRYLEEVALVVEGEPTAAQKCAAGVPLGDELLGLYHGTPRTERAYLPYRLPEKITLFQGPLERICQGDRACVREEVAHTIFHELGHALGFSERRIRALERVRRDRHDVRAPTVRGRNNPCGRSYARPR